MSKKTTKTTLKEYQLLRGLRDETTTRGLRDGTSTHPRRRPRTSGAYPFLIRTDMRRDQRVAVLSDASFAPFDPLRHPPQGVSVVMTVAIPAVADKDLSWMAWLRSSAAVAARAAVRCALALSSCVSGEYRFSSLMKPKKRGGNLLRNLHRRIFF